MTTTDRQNIIDILKEYGGCIEVSDFKLTIQHDELTQVCYDEESDTLRFYAGDMLLDDNAEEVFPDVEELEMIYNLIANEY
jgi:hypothetical protein